MLILTFIFDRQNAYTLFPKQGKGYGDLYWHS